MTPQQLQNQLFEASQAAFEQAAFMLVSRKPDDVQAAARIEQAVSVSIEGPLSGRMVLGVSRELFPVLAGNMVGDDTPLPEDQQRDALGEMANIIAGAILPVLSGPSTVFRLGRPEPTDLAVEEARSDIDRAVRIDLGVDEGRAEILLWLE